MNKEETPVNTTQNQTPQTPEIPVVENPMAQKELEITEKEQLFKKKMRILKRSSIVGGGLILLLIIGTTGYNFYYELTKETFKQDEAIVQKQPTKAELFNKYDNKDLKFSISYPKNDKIVEYKSISEKINKLEIIYSTDTNNNANLTAQNLPTGYILKVTPLNIIGRDLDEITSVKRESFLTTCPKEVEISSAIGAVVYNIAAKSFEVRNCDGDFRVTYVPRFGIFYEIMQMYKGDLGFRQQFKSTTEEMINSLEFYPEDVIPEEPIKTFANTSIKISFNYPKELQEKCCELPNPPSKTAKEIIKLGIKKSEEYQGSFGVFSESTRNTGGKERTLAQYIEEQKQLLISDYKIVKGVEPTMIEEKIKVGDRDATRIRGASWKGNDVIITDTLEGSNFIVISIMNTIGEEFEKVVKDMLDSFKFLER